MNTRNIFISHSWKHSGHYDRLVSLLKERGYFDFRNYSVPEDDPLDANTTSAIREGIRQQMASCSVVLVVAGVHASNSRWMKEEIEMAKGGFDRPKSVIAIRPHSAKRTSDYATSNADETVSWSTESIVGAIRRHS